MSVIRRWWPLLAVVALLAAAGMAASTALLPLSRVTAGSATEPLTVEPTAEARTVQASAEPRVGTGPELPGWVMWAILGLAVLAVAAVAMALFGKAVRSGSRFRRRRVQRPAATQKTAAVEAEVMAALDAGLVELDETDSDPRRAVIACWVRLERAAQGAGVQRLRGDTSTDLVLRLLAAHELDERVLSGFADIYRLARYSPKNEVNESMRDEARAALARLRGELTGVAA